MGNNWFQFKQFHIGQERSALKVGTDGVLLGAWCRVGDGEISGNEDDQHWLVNILDVGTGTGVIALMLAQRSAANIYAVEISERASADALENFQKSPWGNRMHLQCIDFNQFAQVSDIRFDLIASNPPFFRESLRSADHAASVAKHDVTLSFPQLIEGSKRLLRENGRLAVVLPMDALDDFRERARLAGFYLSRKTIVIPKAGKQPKRVLLEFSVSACYPESGELVILSEAHQYTDEFKALTRDFYLNFT